MYLNVVPQERPDFPGCHEFVTTEVVLSSSNYQSRERVRLMSHGGEREREGGGLLSETVLIL